MHKAIFFPLQHAAFAGQICPPLALVLVRSPPVLASAAKPDKQLGCH